MVALAVLLLVANGKFDPWLWTLPGDVTIRLIGTSSTKDGLYSPDGKWVPRKSLPPSVGFEPYATMFGSSLGKRAVVVEAVTPHLDKMDHPGMALRTAGRPFWTMNAIILERVGTARWIGIGYLPALKPGAASFEIGVAASVWKPAGKVRYREGKPVGRTGMRFLRTMDTRKPAMAGQSVRVSIRLPSQVDGQDVRVTVFGRKGSEMERAGSRAYWPKSGIQEYYALGRMRDVSRIELQTRPYRWVRFANVKVP